MLNVHNFLECFLFKVHGAAIFTSKSRWYQLINYDAFELAGGPSPTQGTSEEEPSSPSRSGSSGSQHSAGAQRTGSKVLEVQPPSDTRLNSTTRAPYLGHEDYDEGMGLEQY